MGFADDGRPEQAGVTDPSLDALPRRAARELAPKKTLTGVLGVELVLVPGGTFRMGSDTGRSHEKPVHAVTVSGFCIGRHEVTQSKYEAVMKGNLSRAKGASLPAERVSWHEAAGRGRASARAGRKPADRLYLIGSGVVRELADEERAFLSARHDLTAEGGRRGAARIAARGSPSRRPSFPRRPPCRSPRLRVSAAAAA